jgi:hypothetical protein
MSDLSPSTVLTQMITGVSNLVQKRLTQIVRLLGKLQPDGHRLIATKCIAAKPSAGPARSHRNVCKLFQQLPAQISGALRFNGNDNPPPQVQFASQHPHTHPPCAIFFHRRICLPPQGDCDPVLINKKPAT